MPEPSRNLTPSRGPDVWARTERDQHAHEQRFRWLVGAAGAVMLAAATRGHAPARYLLTAGGVGLLGLALSPRRSHYALEYAEKRRIGRRHRDRVTRASAASFPASDSPSWTPTTGSAPERAGRR